MRVMSRFLLPKDLPKMTKLLRQSLQLAFITLLLMALAPGRVTLAVDPPAVIDTFRLRPGFKIELVAAEPLVRDPVAIDFDENGRLFVVEFPEYNQKHARQQFAAGRVRVLDDTDGDGRFDKSSVYVDQLPYPTALACYDGGVFVGAAPDLLYCKDTDGDDRADVRKVVFTGFGQEFQRAGQAQLNSFRWGLDNRFHVCTNFSGGAILPAGQPQSPPVGVRNRGFLFDPRTHAFEAASGGGQHGLGIDDWGREFRCRNSEPLRLLMYDERYLAGNPYLAAPPPAVNILEGGKYTQLFRVSPDESWRVIRSRLRASGTVKGPVEGEGRPSGYFTSATGITIYRGDAWPAEYRGNGFVGEVASNLVFRARFDEDGIGLIARRADSEVEFLASTDNWFRPVQFANGPDGNLYVVDMHRQLIEGAAFLPTDALKKVDVLAGIDRGRIYRIATQGSATRPSPQLGTAETSHLVGLLEHANGWHRDTAARLLYTRQDRKAVKPLQKLVTESKLPQGRLHALYALDGLACLDATSALAAMSDPHARVREHAVRLAEGLAKHSPQVRQQLIACGHDPDLRVRFQATLSSGIIEPTQRTAALAETARRDGADPWFRMAILSAVHPQQARLASDLLFDSGFRRTTHGRQLLVTLIAQVSQSGRLDQIQTVVPDIEQLDSDPALVQKLLSTLILAARDKTLVRQVAAAHPKVDSVFQQLVGKADEVAVNQRADSRKRLDAIALLELSGFDHALEIADELLDVQQPKSIQLAAVELLARFDRPEVAERLLSSWSQNSPELRARVTEVLSSRGPWLSAWLDAVDDGKIGRNELDSVRLKLFRSHPDEALRARAERLTETLPTRGRQEVVQAYQGALTMSGDAMRGKDHFRRVCSACHRLEGVGKALGADLKAIRNRGSEAILLNMLDPNREVKPQYLTYVVATVAGRVHTGMIENESANSLVLRRPDDSTVALLRIDIEDLRNTGLSFMPEGLEKQLDVQGTADLLAYLDSIE